MCAIGEDDAFSIVPVLMNRRAFLRRAGISALAAGAAASGGNALLDVLGSPSAQAATGRGIITTVAGGGSVGDGSAATSASLSTPFSACVDAAGNLYVADGYFQRIRKVDAQTKVISTVAGAGVAGYTGDGGPAVQATLTLPYDVTVDRAGNLYIADNGNSAVRRVDTNGIITSFVGNGVSGFNGDGIPAASAWLNQIRGVALDAAGNLYIADTLNSRVRVVNMGTQPLVLYPGSSQPLTVQPGQIATAAGIGAFGWVGDGGLATRAHLGIPTNIAFDSKGNMYIGDEMTARVRMVDAMTGIITTVVGTGFPGIYGDGQVATKAQVSNPTDLALDSKDNLYIVDEATNRIRRVDAQTKIISTFAGSYWPAFWGDNGPATRALLNQPMGVTIDAQDNVYIADYNNARVRRVDATTRIMTTAAGSSRVPDLIPATQSIINEGAGTAVDAQGRLYICDQGNHRIRVVGTHGYIATLAGNGLSGKSGDGGLALHARLNGPCDVKVDAAGNLYIADLGNVCIRYVDARTAVITTIAGTGRFGFSGDNGPATAATFDVPRGIDLDAQGGLYIADLDNMRVRFVNTTTAPRTLYGGSANALTVAPGYIVTVAGTGAIGGSGDGGPAVKAALNYPRGVAVDSAGNLYVVEGGSGTRPDSRVRKVDAATGIITTVAGVNGAGYNGDNIPATSATLNGPRGAAVDSAGNLYIADTLNERVRRVDAQTQIITTVAGTGAIGFTGDGGWADEARTFFPRYVTVDNAGNLYVTDSGNSRIRRVAFQ